MQNRLFSRLSSCEKALSLLDRFVSADLPADVTRQVEIHLAGCDTCRKELRTLERVVALVEAVPRQIPPIDLWPRVVRQIQQPPETLPWYAALGRSAGSHLLSRPTWRIPGFVAASAAIAAVIGVTVWGGGNGSSIDSDGAVIRVPVARMTAPVSYASQAEQVAYFEPLADRASLSTISVVSEQSIGGAARPVPAYPQTYPQTRLENAMAVTGGSGQ